MTAFFISEIFHALSGVDGPFRYGSSSFKFTSITLSKYFSGADSISASSHKTSESFSTKAARSFLPVAFK